MKTITLYELATGNLGKVLVLPDDKAVGRNVPDGYDYVIGRFDRLSQKIDLVSGAVVDYQPDQPDSDHEWRATNPTASEKGEQRWRWVKKPEVIERERKSAALLRQIEDTERLQLRSISDLLDDPSDKSARENYERRKAEIDRLRSDLSAVRKGTSAL